MLKRKLFARTGLLIFNLIMLHPHALAQWQSINPSGSEPGANTGIEYSIDTTFSDKKVHVIKIDLTHPRVKLRASTHEERGLSPSEFGKKTQALASINGDFFDGLMQPIGLAIGNGIVWPKSADTKEWSFLACTDNNDCFIEPYNRVTRHQPEWTTVVGGWQILLDPEFEWTKAYDNSCGDFCTVPHPRTALGLSKDRKSMWWVVVEGRQGRLTGLTLSDTTKILKRLGAEWALNLDGGGSSGMSINGKLINGRPYNEPNERRVANCLGVIIDTN